MKIAIDTGPLKNGHSMRGIGVHTRELLLALEQESKRAGEPEVKIEAVDFSRTVLEKYDILHYQFFNPFFLTAPSNACASESKAKKVVTIHDMIPLIYPKHYPPGLKGGLRFSAQKYLLKKIDAIITISETSKKDICRFLGVHPDKVHVIPLAPRRIFRELSNTSLIRSGVVKKYRLPKQFVLYVGDINYNKNIPTLIEACKLAKATLIICGKQALDIEEKGIDIYSLQGPRDWMRYLFGRPHPEIAHYQEVLHKVKRYSKVIRLGYVSDSDLVAIYNLASAYVQPSFYEGFGLPILEAQASGCPVIASKIQAHVEIAENSVLFADPKSPKDFSKKIRQIVKDDNLRESLAKSGLQNSKKYSWQNTARGTLQVYKSI